MLQWVKYMKSLILSVKPHIEKGGGGGGARPSIKTQEKLHRHCNTTLLIKNATSVIRVNKRQQVFHVQQ